jgi:excisionase family DNA binding protein
MNKLLTIDQLAELWQVPKSWIYERTRSNSIPHQRLGKYLRFNVDEVEAWAKSSCSLKFKKFVKCEP